MTQPPRSNIEKGFLILNSTGIIGMLVYATVMYSSLPDTIPTHYNLHGEPDGFGNKGFIWLFPCIAAFIFLIFTNITRFPDGMNYPANVTEENKLRIFAYTRFMMQVIVFEIVFFSMYTTIIGAQIAKGNAEGLGTYTVAIFGLIVISTIVSMLMKYRKLK
jgi:uncharacterized membrane protein